MPKLRVFRMADFCYTAIGSKEISAMDIMSTEDKVQQIRDRLQTEDAQGCLEELKVILDSELGELVKAEVA